MFTKALKVGERYKHGLTSTLPYFLPPFQEFYDELGDDKQFEVVFMSGDRTEKDLVEYMTELHGDWFFLPLDCPANEWVSEKFAPSLSF
jgi:hypothetical protein